MQLFILSNSCLGSLSFPIKSFKKTLGEKKSDITVKVDEKGFFFVKRSLRNSRIQ